MSRASPIKGLLSIKVYHGQASKKPRRAEAVACVQPTWSYGPAPAHHLLMDPMTGSILAERAEMGARERPGAVSPAAAATCRQRRLSHEVGTPLNAILGNVELLLDGSAGPLTKEAGDCLAEIQAAGQDLLRQSRMLLLLVQALEAHRPQADSVTSLGQLFAGALRQAQPAGRASGLALEGAAAQASIVGDPFWLQTFARCVVDVYATPVPRGPLRIQITPPTRLRIDWQEFRETAVPATATALLRRIVELHGGRMLATAKDAFILCWPAARLLLTDQPGRAGP